MEEERVIIESKSKWAKRKKLVVVILLFSIIFTATFGIVWLISSNNRKKIYQDHHHGEYQYSYYLGRDVWRQVEDKDWKDYETDYERFSKRSEMERSCFCHDQRSIVS